MPDERFLRFLPQQMRNSLINSKINQESLQEIRIRIGKPIIIRCANGELVFGELPSVTDADVREIVQYISNYSLYAYEDEMRQGFITIKGGHRIGLCGQVILEKGKVKNLKHVSSINIRISHQIKGCADSAIPYLLDEGKLYHTLVISPPGCGKTTLLRDIIRQISDGNSYIKGQTVGVVDERSEIGGCYKGIPQNQLGMRTDVLDGCPKAEGMLMLIRTMGPDVIAVDEIGTEEDVHAVEYAMHCGCKMLATVHGTSITDMKKRPVLGEMIQNRLFERYVVMNNKNKAGNIEGIYDGTFRRMYSDCGSNNTGRNRAVGKTETAESEYEIFTENHLPDTK